jgi:hypothetical protein
MRYLKVFLLVLFFLLVMMFFVQNQASFADPVVLRFDVFFLPPVESVPLPLYSIMLVCFALGALTVLLMLILDRMTIMYRLSSIKKEKKTLGKKLEALQADLDKTEEAYKAAEARLQSGPAGQRPEGLPAGSDSVGLFGHRE